MSDIVKALEAAAEAMNAYHHTDEDGTSPVDRIMREASRAAVLAFLRAMPDEMTVHIPPNEPHISHLSYMFPNVPSHLAAAIEKEML